MTAETEMSSAGFYIDFSCDQCGEWIDVRADDVFAEAMEYFRGRRGAEEE